MDNRGVVEQAEDTSDRTLYGIDGPRRRPRPETPAAALATPSPIADAPTIADAPPVVVLPEAEAPPAPRVDPTVRERWREERTDRSRDRATGDRRIERPISPPDTADLEARFEALRVVMATELGRRIDAALARMEGTFEREIEALRNANHEEAKRLRSANGEDFVRIRAADTQELERIRRAVDEGIERLCSVLEGQLDRVWGANDVELDRIRSAGADRLAEVHDLLIHELARVRAQQPPAAARRPWYRRKERTAAE